MSNDKISLEFDENSAHPKKYISIQSQLRTFSFVLLNR